MFSNEFLSLTLNELRKVVVDLSKDDLTDDSLTRAITMNENIRTAYGLTFKPADIVRIARADKAVEVFRIIEEAIPDVKAEPMYPDFPTFVIGMDEGMFRFHQMLHYFSTYGIEDLFGTEVTEGWLPKKSVKNTKKTKKDKNLFPEKVIELLDASEAYLEVYKAVVSKRERMTIPEMDLVRICVENLDPKEIGSVKIPFKENIFYAFSVLMTNLSGEKRVESVKALFQNSGDVFKNAKRFLKERYYNLTTGEKRALVRVLESFPIADFKGNLMLSNVKREDTLTVLRYIDYNKFSKAEAHKEAVRELRNSELRSWEGRLKAALKISDEKGLSVVAERPGMFLRFVSALMKSGVDPEKIKAELVKNSSKLSTQTLVRLCTYFSNGACGYFEEVNNDIWKGFDTDKLEEIFVAALKGKLESVETPIKGQKIFIDEGQYSFEHSVIQTNDKSDEGGYIRSGLAMKVPYDCDVIRLFTYWNDKNRVDLDLHGFGIKDDGDIIHIGWNGGFRYGTDASYKTAALVHSGDITHSNAAEYIDVDLKRAEKEGIHYVRLTLHDYTARGFKNIDEVLVGVMGVSKKGQEVDVKLYNPANCFFSHELKADRTSMFYGFLDLETKELTFVGKDNVGFLSGRKPLVESLPKFTLKSYLDLLLETQGCELVETKEDADSVLRLDKGKAENETSLIDENYWMDL